MSFPSHPTASLPLIAAMMIMMKAKTKQMILRTNHFPSMRPPSATRRPFVQHHRAQSRQQRLCKLSACASTRSRLFGWHLVGTERYLTLVFLGLSGMFQTSTITGTYMYVLRRRLTKLTDSKPLGRLGSSPFLETGRRSKMNTCTKKGIR